MKKWSIVLNAVLFILVAILFYFHFSGRKAVTAPAPAAVKNGAPQPSMRIAFVNLDSLEAHYDYFREKQAELAKKQQAIQKELGGLAKEIQFDIADLQKRASTLTQAEGEAVQKKIMEKRQNLQQREDQLRQKFLQEQQQFNAELHARLDAFLKQYNAGKRYTYILSYSAQASDILYKDEAYDITADVIRGLNAQGK